MSTSSPILEIKRLSRAFGRMPILNEISLRLFAGVLVHIGGTNGSGKSTLINCVSGFDRFYSGEILFKNTCIDRFSCHKRARMGIVRTFQTPHLFEGLRVWENLLMGRKACVSILEAYISRSRERSFATDELLANNLRSLWDRPSLRLSFGEMKLVNTARALSSDAEILLLDEPLSSIHGDRRNQILNAINERKKSGTAIIVIEHQFGDLREVADISYFLENGKLSRFDD